MKYILFTLIILFNNIQSLLAADDFKIENVIISNTSSNTKEAKEKAIEDGKIRAFNMLLKKLFSHSNTLPSETADDIEFFISDIELSNEKFSSKTYLARMNVTFNKSQIQKHYKDLHLPITTEKLTSHSGHSQNYVTCIFKSENLQEWVKMREILQEKVKGIESVLPLLASHNSITYQIYFSVSAKELADNMTAHHIKLIQDKGMVELKFE